MIANLVCRLKQKSKQVILLEALCAFRHLENGGQSSYSAVDAGRDGNAGEANLVNDCESKSQIPFNVYISTHPPSFLVIHCRFAREALLGTGT